MTNASASVADEPGHGAHSAAYLPPRPTGIQNPGLPLMTALPAAYNMALFELVVVDPEWVFMSWEITAQQREGSRLAYGDDWFGERRLVVLFQDAIHGLQLSRAELYGDTGLWFHRLACPGACVVARLGYEARGARYEFNSAGPLQIPRTTPIEPLTFKELQAAYAVDISGRISLAAIREKLSATAPVAVPGAGAPEGAVYGAHAGRAASSRGGLGGGPR